MGALVGVRSTTVCSFRGSARCGLARRAFAQGGDAVRLGLNLGFEVEASPRPSGQAGKGVGRAGTADSLGRSDREGRAGRRVEGAAEQGGATLVQRANKGETTAEVPDSASTERTAHVDIVPSYSY